MTGAASPAGSAGVAAEPALAEDAPAAGHAPGAFVTIDRGTATCAATIIGRAGGRWRLLSAAAVPAGTDVDALLAVLLGRVRAADPALAAGLGLGGRAAPGAFAGEPGVADVLATLPRIEAVGASAPLVFVLAATEASRRALEADAAAAGWRTGGASAEEADPLEMTRLATRPGIGTLLVGTGDPATADERDLLGELLALAAGVAERRPDVPVVLVGAAAARASEFPLATETVAVARPRGDDGGDLRTVLAARRGGPGDARQALVAAAATLAGVLRLRIELLEVGMRGALRVRADPGAQPGAPSRIAAAEVPTAVLGLADDDAALDRVEGWTTLGIDRARLRDRLADLRLAPWADLGGDGAVLRAAALRAAVARLVEATEAELGGPAPDLVVLAGGAWSSIPAPAALLVVADAIRRPGVVQVALDAARLLAPLGTIPDEDERAEVVRDLAADVLVPLGTLAVGRGIRGGRHAGHLRLAGEDAPLEVDLAAGRLVLVDLPPGQVAEATLTFRTPVDLGTRGRAFAVRATGGLAGFVVDLRDVPLRLPERAEERRDLLARWEAVLWPGRDL